MTVNFMNVPFSTDASQNATEYSGKVNGRLLGIIYQYGDALTGASVAVTGEETGQVVLTKTALGTVTVQFNPRLAINLNTDGSALSFYDKVPIPNERLKFAITVAGASKTGNFLVLTESD